MKKALIVFGGWPGHEPEICSKIISGWLERDGSYYPNRHNGISLFT